MNEIYQFFKECGTFYLATNDDNQPHVRPFGAVSIFDGKLYLVTSNQKEVYKQMMKNPKVEMCGMKDNKWMRLMGEVELDDRREARVAMLDDNPPLLQLYSVDDNKMVVFRFVNGTATLSSFMGASVTYQL